MKIKSIVFAVASTLSMTALADNASVDSAEIQKAIQLLETKATRLIVLMKQKNHPLLVFNLKIINSASLTLLYLVHMGGHDTKQTIALMSS